MQRLASDSLKAAGLILKYVIHQPHRLIKIIIVNVNTNIDMDVDINLTIIVIIITTTYYWIIFLGGNEFPLTTFYEFKSSPSPPEGISRWTAASLTTRHSFRVDKLPPICKRNVKSTQRNKTLNKRSFRSSSIFEHPMMRRTGGYECTATQTILKNLGLKNDERTLNEFRKPTSVQMMFRTSTIRTLFLDLNSNTNEWKSCTFRVWSFPCRRPGDQP